MQKDKGYYRHRRCIHSHYSGASLINPLTLRFISTIGASGLSPSTGASNPTRYLTGLVEIRLALVGTIIAAVSIVSDNGPRLVSAG